MSFSWWGLLFGPTIGRQRRVARRIHAPQHRRLHCETLEDRRLLSVTVAPITTGSNGTNTFTVTSGKDLYVPITGSDSGQTITYSVSGGYNGMVATVMPSTNPTLVLDVSGTNSDGTSFSGAMTFQLFQNLAPNTVANIVNLVNSGEYKNNPTEFYRVLTGAPDPIIQGGINLPGSNVTLPSPIADEFNGALTFNSPGLLAMVNAGPGTGSSEFFITAPGVDLSAEPTSNWNFQYSIFGQLTSGFDIYNDIANAQLTANPQSGEDSLPAMPITITSASIENDMQDGVVQISEPSGFSNTATFTVTANAPDGTTAQQSFTVNSEAPSSSLVSTADPLVLSAPPNVTIAFNTYTADDYSFSYDNTSLTTAENTAVSMPLEADVLPALAGGSYTFSVLPVTKTFGDAPLTSSTGISDVGVSITPGSGNTPTLTLTPSGDFTGTLNLLAEVDYQVTVNSQTLTLRDDLPFTLTVNPSVLIATLEPAGGIGAANASQSTTTVVVDYSDTNGSVDPASLGTGNITVSNGSTPAAVTGYTVLSNGNVSYTIAAPGGTWAASPQGEYTVSLVAGSAKDLNGNGVAAATLGEFFVDTALPSWGSVTGTTLTINGQSSNDSLNIAFTDTTDFVVTFDGQSVSFNTSQINNVQFLAATTPNTDQVVFSGNGASEQATFVADTSASLTIGSSFQFGETGAATVYFYGNASSTATYLSQAVQPVYFYPEPIVAAADQALSSDVAPLEKFVGTPSYSYLASVPDGNLFEMAAGFGSVSDAAINSADTAYLYSSGGALTMASPNSSAGPYNYYSYYPSQASIALGNQTVSVSGYSSVYGYAASAADTAQFYDSGPSDKFVGSIPYSYLTDISDNSLFEMAVGYANVTADDYLSYYSSGLNPPGQAYLYSDGGALTMGENTSSIALGSTIVTANNYPTVLAFASASGTDTATFLPASDTLLDISSAYSYLTSNTAVTSNMNFDAAVGYQSVAANAPTSSLILFNVASGETFVGGPTSATLASGTFQATVSNFSTNVLAEGTSDNTATLNASTGQNLVLADGPQATLEEGTGGTVATTGFGLVNVNSTAGGTNLESVGAIDFVLSLHGNWSEA